MKSRCHDPLYKDSKVPQSCKVIDKKFEKWSNLENSKYIDFLKQHGHQLHTESKRRSFKVFTVMSRMLQNRSSEQCRTHHQKMFKKYKSIECIIDSLKHKIQKVVQVRIIKRRRKRKPQNIEIKKLSQTLPTQQQRQKVGDQGQNLGSLPLLAYESWMDCLDL